MNRTLVSGLLSVALVSFVINCSKHPPDASPARPVQAATPTPAAAPVAVATPLPAQTGEAPATPAGAGEAEQGGSAQAAGTAARPAGGQPRPYDRVITAGAVTRSGLFTTHRIGERLLFEIPRRELNKDMLLLQRVAAGSGTSSSMVVRWEREDNRVFLRRYSFSMVADTAQPIYLSVAAQNHPPIIAVFNIESFGPDSAAVIDVTRLYTSNVGELVGVRGIVADRTWIERVAAYPDNVEVLATQTGMAAPEGSPGGTPPVATTVQRHWSMLRLPESPMLPRLADRRVGYFTIAQQDYGLPDHRATTREYIRRFRLEKRDPGAQLSEPVQPIVFWIDPATPEWLVPWVRRGVEDWQPAFEEAGFKNAIIARQAPGGEEDADWSIHDARHSMIYWRASTTQNASGGQTVDPRTGEIMKAEVNMFHNVMNLLRNWYFIQAGPLDPRTRQLPLPDSLMGRLVQYVVSHEVGHAIGLPHNWKAAAYYPVDSLRSESFLRRMGGHVPTLMDYSRFNYVAQPEDKIPPELLIPTIGPYDRFAIMWGYKPVPGAKTADGERTVLDEWARWQDEQPWLRYETPDATNDPGRVTEAVGSADPVKATTLALKNLHRVVDMLIPVAEVPGEDYRLLRELYGQAVSQWGTYMSHVAALVGGADSQERYGTGVRFTPVSRDRQRAAVQFLTRNAFQPPAYFLDPELLRRLESEGAVGRIAAAQASVINSLLSEPRLNRLVEYEALARRPSEAYTVAELAADLRQGIWGELSSPRIQIDVYRRHLQRSHLAALDRIVNARGAAGEGAVLPVRTTGASDVRPILRGELIELERVIRAAIPRAADATTRLHLEDLQFSVARILDPK